MRHLRKQLPCEVYFGLNLPRDCRRPHCFRRMQDQPIHQYKWGKKRAHTVESRNFTRVFNSCGVAVHGHPTTAARNWICSVIAICGKMPIDEEVKGEPANKRERAFSQARRDRHRCAEGTGPHKNMDDVLNHRCERARSVPLSAGKRQLRRNPVRLKGIRRLLN